MGVPVSVTACCAHLPYRRPQPRGEAPEDRWISSAAAGLGSGSTPDLGERPGECVSRVGFLGLEPSR